MRRAVSWPERAPAAVTGPDGRRGYDSGDVDVPRHQHPGVSLTSRERELTDSAHEFAESVMRPVAGEHDRDGRWPQEVIDEFWRRGLMNFPLPERYGGPGMSYLELCLVKEELGWGCAGMGTSLFSNGLAMMPLLLAGSDRLKDEYLSRLGEAPVLASFGLTEPSAGSDVAALRTTTTRQGSGWVLNRSKCSITNASHAEWFTTFARTEPGRPRAGPRLRREPGAVRHPDRRAPGGLAPAR